MPDIPGDELLSVSNDRDRASDARTDRFPAWKLAAVFLILLGVAFFLHREGFDSPLIYDGAYFVNSKAGLFAMHEPLKIIRIVPARPLFMATFYGNYLLTGLDPYYLRFANLVLLAATGLVLMLLILAIFRIPGVGVRGTDRDKQAVSFFLGLLFVIHPLQSFVVLYTWQREAIMACFFYFSALGVYVAVRSGRTRAAIPGYTLVAFLFLAGFLSKENLATFPVMLVLVELILFRQSLKQLFSRALTLGLIVVPPVLAYLAVTHVLHGPDSEIGRGVWERLAGHYEFGMISPLQVAMTECRVLFSYLSMIVAPFLFSPEFMRAETISVSLFSPPVTLFACASVIGLIGIAVVLARRRPLSAFGILFFIISLMPESLLIPQYLFFSYRAILPMAGLLLIAGEGVLALLAAGRERLSRRTFREAVAVATLVPVICLAWVTYLQSREWSPQWFWRSPAAKLAPYTKNIEPVPYMDISVNCMSELFYSGNFDELIKLFTKMVGTVETPRNDPSPAADPPNDMREAIEKFVTTFEGRPLRSAGALLAVGAAFSATGKTADAIMAYEKAAELNPDHPDVHVSLGVLLEQTGKLSDAVKHYRKAIEKNPGLLIAYNCLGNALKRSGRWNEAAQQFAIAVQIGPSDVMAYINLGLTLQETGHLPEAIAWLRKAVEIAPSSAEAHHKLGRALAQAGRGKQAVTHYRKAIELNPRMAVAYGDLGLALEYMGDIDAAEENYRAALEIEPGSAVMHTVLGMALMKAGDTIGAIDEYEKAIAIDPTIPLAYNNLGVALEKTGHLSQAIAQYRKAIAIDPRMANAYNNLGVALRKLGKPAEAAKQYEKAIEIDPTLATAYLNLGVVLEKSGKRSAALERFKTAVRLQPGSAEAHYHLANCLLESGNIAQSIEAYRQAVRLNPSIAEAHAKLAVALLKVDKVPEAIVTLGKALALNKENVEVLHALGSAFARMNKIPEATRYFERALAINPDHGETRQSLERLKNNEGRPSSSLH